MANLALQCRYCESKLVYKNMVIPVLASRVALLLSELTTYLLLIQAVLDH